MNTPCPTPAPPRARRLGPPRTTRDFVFQAWWILAWNSAVALVFVLFFNAGNLPSTWVVTNVIGFACWGYALLAAAALRPLAHRSTALYIVAITVVAVPLGVASGGAIIHWWTGDPRAGIDWHGLTDRPTLGVTFLLAVISIAFWYGRAREHKLAADAATRQAALEAQERRASEAQLKLLQAQIEPHFLFNTLGVLDGLIATEPVRARRLLADLNDYLRAALAATRADGPAHTLGDELGLITAYLQIMQARFGPRLQYALQADPALRALPFPAMLLQPLVENAIRHGIEPAKDGGTLELRVTRMGDRLEIAVEDSGLGVRDDASTRGTGAGLANVRARLLALHGTLAQLTLEERRPRGTIARIVLPVQGAPSCPPP